MGSNATTGKERNPIWDNVRIFLMIVVVVGHVVSQDSTNSHMLESAGAIIWGFHMPLFIFISGLFHKNTKIKEKMVSYIAIYIVLKILFAFVRVLGGYGFSFSVLSEKGLPWFVFALAAFVGLSYFLRDIDKKYVLIISLLLGMFSGLDKTVGDKLIFSRIIVYYPYYVLGTMIPREKIEKLMKKPAWKIGGFVVFGLWCAVCYFYLPQINRIHHLFSGRNPFADGIRPYGIWCRLLTYVIAVTVGFAFILMVPTKRLGPITKCGEKTLQIYFWHHVCLQAIMILDVYTKYFQASRLGHLLWLLVGIPYTFIFALPIFKYPVKWLMKPVTDYDKRKMKQE